MTKLPLYKGLDLSRHQKMGKVNFNECKGLGYSFVILRAGYGKSLSQKDEAFESHYKAAKAADLAVGAYHYSYAENTEEAIMEARVFLEIIKDKKLDYPVVFDIEDKVQKKLTNSQRTDIALAFMTAVEAAGYYTMLYSSASWLGSKFDWDRTYRGVPLRHFDVWVAAYVDSEANITKYYNGHYGIWQYTSGITVRPIYKSRLDHNYAYKNYPAIIRRAGLNHLN